MHHMQKQKYLNLKKGGMDPQVLEKLMLEDRHSPEVVTAFLAEPLSDDDQGGQGVGQPPATTAPTETKGAEPKKEASTPHGETPDSVNSVYEEWKMEKTISDDKSVSLEKVKKLREVKMDDSRAERLNDHANNRLVKYFLKVK